MDKTRKKEEEKVKTALRLNGYPEWAIHQGTFKPKATIANTSTANVNNANAEANVTNSHTSASHTNATNNTKANGRHKGYVTLPYYAGITETLSHHLKQVGISTTIKTRGSLREHLVHPKDKLERLDVNGVIYYHACAGANNNACTDSYVGESARAATAWNAEHFSTSQTAPGLYKSAIMQHAADAQHHFRKEDIKVLSREPNWHERGIRESIYIRGLSPTLNRNEGQHTLPHCYNSIIQKVVKKPEPPDTHQPTEPRLNTAKRGPGRPRAQQTEAANTDTVPKTVTPVITTQQPTHNMTTRSRRAPIGDDRATSDQSF